MMWNWAVAVFLMSLTVGAGADDKQTLIWSEKLTDETVIHLDVSVGEVDIMPSDDQQIELEVELEKKRGFLSWFKKKKDINPELDIRWKADHLYLSIKGDHKNFQEDWRIYLPAVHLLNVEMGVGDLEIEGIAASIRADLGVGDASIRIARENAGQISAEVGVGDASIRGKKMDGVRQSRAVVSAESSWRGEGKQDVELEVGVGDANIRIN